MKINLIPSVTKTQCFTNLSFNSLFQSISDTSSDLQKLLRYLNDDTEIVAFSEISFAAAAFLINLVLWLKDLKLLVSAISALKIVPLTLKQNQKPPVASK